MADTNQWTNTPNLEWQNTPSGEWYNDLITTVLEIKALIVAKSKAYYFEAEDKTRVLISKIKNYYFESKNKP